MSVEFDIAEVQALASHFARAGTRFNESASQVLRKTAFDIEAVAKFHAPVDTGALRSSISTSITGDLARGALTAEVGATAIYAAFVEFGTSTQPGQPYLGPAFDRMLPGFEAALSRLADQLLDG